jgi:hypothetical protein
VFPQRSAKADAPRSEQVSDQKKPPEKGVGEKSTRVFALCGIELNRAKQILATVRAMARRTKTQLFKDDENKPPIQISWNRDDWCSDGRNSRCRSVWRLHVYVSPWIWCRLPDEDAGNKGSIRQHSQEYRSFPDSHWLSLQGVRRQEREDDDVPWLQPHVPADDQKLIPAKVSGGGNRSFAR